MKRINKWSGVFGMMLVTSEGTENSYLDYL